MYYRDYYAIISSERGCAAMVLKRKAYQHLLDWKNTDNGATALLINGARRVGKSHLCKQFAQNEYRSSIIIDFANTHKIVRDAIENDSYVCKVIVSLEHIRLISEYIPQTH